MKEQINLVEFTNNLLSKPVTNAEHQALRDITKPCVRENLNEACNRRGQLALSTVIAAIKSRIYAVQQADMLTPEDRRVIENMRDIIDDIQTIKRGFPCPSEKEPV